MPFGTAEHPVNRPFFVAFDMVTIKVLDKVFPNIFAYVILNEFEVFFEVFFSKKSF